MGTTMVAKRHRTRQDAFKQLTHPVRGLERYEELFAKLQSPNGAIKIYCEVAE